MRAMPAEPPFPFADFAPPVREQSQLRQRITAAYRRPEAECVAALLPQAEAPEALKPAIAATARGLVAALRAKGQRGGVEGLVKEYSLSSQEGVALMCLAEALLRIPDNDTRDALIRDKIAGGDWQGHLGGDKTLFVNAATWGLMVTGRLTASFAESGLGPRRRTGDPPWGRYGDGADGRTVRHRRDDRRSARTQPQARGAGLCLQLRHAGRSGHHRAGRGAIPQRL
jgi:hypothetical protein